MGNALNSLDKVDEGLFISGIEALSDISRLHEKGIKSVLNAASRQLYSSDGFPRNQLEEQFSVKALECQDSEDCNLSVHFHDAANFIEEGRRQGGVVVHCAAGISRSSTSLIAYLMIKQHLSLNAAFLKVFAARSIVEPNAGFWRQLLDLEAVLKAEQVELLEPTAELIELARSGNGSEPDSKPYQDPMSALENLHANASKVTSFVTHILTSHVYLEDGADVEAVKASLSEAELGGTVLHSVSEVAGKSGLFIRAKCVPAMTGLGLQRLLQQVPGIKDVTVEL